MNDENRRTVYSLPPDHRPKIDLTMADYDAGLKNQINYLNYRIAKLEGALSKFEICNECFTKIIE